MILKVSFIGFLGDWLALNNGCEADNWSLSTEGRVCMMHTLGERPNWVCELSPTSSGARPHESGELTFRDAPGRWLEWRWWCAFDDGDGKLEPAKWLQELPLPLSLDDIRLIHTFIDEVMQDPRQNTTTSRYLTELVLEVSSVKTTLR